MNKTLRPPKFLPISKLTRPFLIRFFSDPRKKWITAHFSDGQGGCCARGHVYKAVTGAPNLPIPEVADAIHEKLIKAFGVRSRSDVHYINDGYCAQFKQRTPRARILAALRAAGKGGR